MLKPLLLSLLAGASAGAGVALVLPLALGEPTPPVTVTEANVAELQKRLQEAQGRIRDLANRVAARDARPTSPPPTPHRLDLSSTVTKADLDKLRQEIWSALARLGADPGGKAFKTQVAKALEDIRQRQAVDRVKASMKKKEARREQRLRTWSSWLNLSPPQQDELRLILTARDEREQEVIRLWEQGTPPEELGRLKRENERTFHRSLQEVLTPPQLETFQEKFRPPGNNAGK